MNQINRQFKFRAWYPYEKKWLDYFYIGQHGEIYEEIQVGFGPFDSFRRPDCILQQFTGITDKNGTEIYEGDILKEYLDWWGNGRFNGIVSYQDAECKFIVSRKGNNQGALDYEMPSEGYEIIGNIFENPELIKL